MSRGFTLIQLSILITVASLVLVAILPSSRTNLTANQTTTTKLNTILNAMRSYQTATASLPCPADASQPIGSTNYGVAAANTGTSNNCSGGTPAANSVDSTNNIAVGMVPVRALGLSNDYALDSYGRTITYAVDTDATVCFSGTLPGKITVTDNGSANTTIAALVSHGADGHGAWLPLTGSSGTATRLNAGSTDADQLTNAHVNSSFTPTTPLTNFVRKQGTSTFDDLVVYQSNLWTLNSAPASTSALFPTMTSIPPNGSYFTGTTLPFTVTFPSMVNVSGTPNIAITLPSGTVYATYFSGSGSTALTFNYLIGSGDYAPLGMTSIASPISLNGGSITVGGQPACLTYAPPSVTGIYINAIELAVPFYKSTTANSYLNLYNRSGSAFAKNSNVSMSVSLTTSGDSNGTLSQGNPDGGQVGVFSPDNTYLAFGDASASGPWLQMYKLNSSTGIYSKLSSPFSTAPGSDVQDARWSNGGTYFAVAQGSGNGLLLYQRSGDAFTLQSTPTESGHAGMTLAFSHDVSATYLAFSYNATNSPVDIYQISSGTYPNTPTTILSPAVGTIWDLRFSPDDSFLAIASTKTSQSVTIYSQSAGTFTPLSTPNAGNQPGSAGNAVAWSPNGTLLAVGVDSSPHILIYTHTGTGASAVFTKSTTVDPGSTVNGLAWSADGTYLAATLASSSTPLVVYSYNGSSFTPLSITGKPGGYAWRPDFTHTTIQDN